MPGRVRSNVVQSAISLLKKVNITVPRRLWGTAFRIPILGSQGLGLMREHEPELCAAIRASLEGKSGAFIDVGVNIGQTLLAVQSTRCACTYIGFEPNPAACAYVQELVRANEFSNVTVLPMALSDKPGIRCLHLDGDTTSANASLTRAHKRHGFFSRTVTVACERGDDILDQLGLAEVSIIKIDVEGTEVDVLNGFERTVLRHQPIIFAEVLGQLTTAATEVNDQRRSNAEALARWARSYQYSVWALTPEGRPLPVDDLVAESGRGGGRNYMLQPSAGLAEVS